MNHDLGDPCDEQASSETCSQLIDFLHASPTPYHATSNLAAMMRANGFVALDENSDWKLDQQGRYYVTRGASSIVAFVVGDQDQDLRIVGAHTDSPCLKLKPQPEMIGKGYDQMGVEVYGGVLLNPWFDRDLSLAGRVNYINKQGQIISVNVDFKRAIAVIPSLAIHLNRTANENKTVNPQIEMNPILAQAETLGDLREKLCQLLVNGELDIIDDDGQSNKKLGRDCHQVLDFNLSFYDVQVPSLVGFDNEFLASARLDNLLSCFVGAQSLIRSQSKNTLILVCNDHEEIGSQSNVGAKGPFLQSVIHRLESSGVLRNHYLGRSVMMSVDNAHGVHPNYPSKHDDNHGPLLNKGPVLKYDANQSYATNIDTASFIRALASSILHTEIPLQSYVTRADMRCGSTIGPITSTLTGVNALDIGVPTFAMHSIRELCGVKDIAYLGALIDRFLASELPLA